jgi:hypothetical protein
MYVMKSLDLWRKAIVLIPKTATNSWLRTVVGMNSAQEPIFRKLWPSDWLQPTPKILAWKLDIADLPVFRSVTGGLFAFGQDDAEFI